MLAGMPGETFQEWKRYYELEPWGDERMDRRFALHGYAVCRALGLRHITLKAFLPLEGRDEPEVEQTPEQMVRIAHMITAHQEGRLAAARKP